MCCTIWDQAEVKPSRRSKSWESPGRLVLSNSESEEKSSELSGTYSHCSPSDIQPFVYLKTPPYTFNRYSLHLRLAQFVVFLLIQLSGARSRSPWPAQSRGVAWLHQFLSELTMTFQALFSWQVLYFSVSRTPCSGSYLVATLANIGNTVLSLMVNRSSPRPITTEYAI